jgi:hypothetical protein
MRAVRVDELYEEDFFAWTRSQARELRRLARTRPNVVLDVAHIAEEIADLGTERRDAVRGWTARIIERLLLLEHSPARSPAAAQAAPAAPVRRGATQSAAQARSLR